MYIQDIFQRDINRNINGVVQVEQSQAEIVSQEVDEYVVTTELHEYFGKFFEVFGEALDTKTTKCGVWISGFFGSGKSHFLKMLSYLLSNKPDAQGKTVLQRFEPKFAEYHDALSWEIIKNTVQGHPCETILFNIQSQENTTASSKWSNPVLAVFAKVFFNHLGYYGNNIEVVRLEQFLEQEGMYEEFVRAFAELDGKNRVWRERRHQFLQLRPKVAQALQKAMGYSAEEAMQCLLSRGQVELSVESLAEEVKQYVLSKPDDFRLIFLLDEVGQFVAEHIDYLLTLQTIVEKLGSVCQGRVWVICTAQDKLDDIKRNIKQDEFSKISARFPIRLDLTSGSAREVIEKRVLAKTIEAEAELADLYHANQGILCNLFAFYGVRKDVLGYSGPEEFVRDYPFVPYQFDLMKEVFTAIRKHSSSGRHMSGGERSMLSGFQEAAQAIERQGLGALSPFVKVYDTICNQLDSSVRAVINRCEQAASKGLGLRPGDEQVLKLLYLVRYLDGMPATQENLLSLSIDNIKIDRMQRRMELDVALERLVKEGYVARAGERFNFLTDLEQDIQREIEKTRIDPEFLQAELAKKIKEEIFKDSTKHQYRGNDYEYGVAVDESSCSGRTGAMGIKIITPRYCDYGNEIGYYVLSTAGKERKEAVVVWSDDCCMELLERIQKIESYTRSHAHQGETEQTIIATYREEQKKLVRVATEKMNESIRGAKVFINGVKQSVSAPDARSFLNQVLDELVRSVFSKIDLVEHSFTLDEVVAILAGQQPTMDLTDGDEDDSLADNKDALKEVLDDLEVARQNNRIRTVFEVKDRLLKPPFGWKEVDIAGLIALLWRDNMVQIKRNGEIIAPSGKALDCIYRKDVRSTEIRLKVKISQEILRQARQTLMELEGCNVSFDEDSIFQTASDIILDYLEQWRELISTCKSNAYPGINLLERGIEVVTPLKYELSDSTAFLNKLVSCSEELCAARRDIEDVETFFSGNWKDIFNLARQRAKEIGQDGALLSVLTSQRLEKVLELLKSDSPNFDFNCIPVLKSKYDVLEKAFASDLETRIQKLSEEIDEAYNAVKAGVDDLRESDEVNAAWTEKAELVWAGFEKTCEQLRDEIARTKGIRLLDGLAYSINNKRNEALAALLENPEPKVKATPVADPGNGSQDGTIVQPDGTCVRPDGTGVQSGGASVQSGDGSAPTSVTASTSGAVQGTAPGAPPTRDKTRRFKCPSKVVRNKAEVEVYVARLRKDLIQALDEAEQVEVE